MSNKMITVDDTKWLKFKKWCVNHNTTIRKELDKFLDEVGQ